MGEGIRNTTKMKRLIIYGKKNKAEKLKQIP
jgi:hypothetical protein